MIYLYKEHFLGSGSKRDVYFHPRDKDLCIKIQRSAGTQNLNEELFLNKYEHNDIFPEYFGRVSTNLGIGLIFKIVKDYDGTTSKSLDYYLINHIISRSNALEFIKKIEDEVIKNKYLIHDGAIHNILLQKTAENIFRPILIDGFGARSQRLRYKIRLMVPLLAVRKSKSKIKVMRSEVYSIV